VFRMIEVISSAADGTFQHLQEQALKVYDSNLTWRLAPAHFHREVGKRSRVGVTSVQNIQGQGYDRISLFVQATRAA
jgi:hypothetical protein